MLCTEVDHLTFNGRDLCHESPRGRLGRDRRPTDALCSDLTAML